MDNYNFCRDKSSNNRSKISPRNDSYDRNQRRDSRKYTSRDTPKISSPQRIKETKRNDDVKFEKQDSKRSSRREDSYDKRSDRKVDKKYERRSSKEKSTKLENRDYDKKHQSRHHDKSIKTHTDKVSVPKSDSGGTKEHNEDKSAKSDDFELKHKQSGKPSLSKNLCL